MKDIQRGIVGGNPPATTTQQSCMRNSYFIKIESFLFPLSLANNPYAASAASSYPPAQQPSAPPTGGPLPAAPAGSKRISRCKHLNIDVF